MLIEVQIFTSIFADSTVIVIFIYQMESMVDIISPTESPEQASVPHNLNTMEECFFSLTKGESLLPAEQLPSLLRFISWL